MKGDRTYSSGKLKTWIQRRCDKCQRFLTKEEKKFCSRCAPKEYIRKVF
jgi:rRNA maturation endonuclease Nob1